MCAIPVIETQNTVPIIYNSPNFITAYCEILFRKSRQLLNENKYADAMVGLKELHTLNFANIDAYLLAIKSLLLNNQAEEGKKIAIGLLKDMSDKMNQEQTETLGDLFMQLKMDNEAEKAYLISADKFSK